VKNEGKGRGAYLKSRARRTARPRRLGESALPSAGSRGSAYRLRAVSSFGAFVAQVREHRRLVVALGVALALALLFAPTLVGHAKFASDRFTFADDVRVLIYPQFRLEDPTLFPHDPAVTYYLASLPDGYALLYRVLAPLFGVVALSKALPYVLFAVTLACVSATAWRLAGGAAAFGSLALALGSSYLLGRMAGGLPRGFAAPLLAAGTLALVQGRARALAIIAVVAAGFYPAAALTLGVTLALLLVMPRSMRGAASAWSLRRRLVVIGVTAAAAALLLLPSAWRLRAWGPAIGPDLVVQYPEAGPDGRFARADRPPFPALPVAAVEPLRAVLVGDGAPIAAACDARGQAAWLAPCVAVLGLVGCAWLARRRVEARRFLLLSLAIVLCHTAALLLEPRLFLPERYVAYAVPVLVLVAVPAMFGACRDGVRTWVRAVPWVLNALVVLVLGAHGVTWSGLTVRIPDGDRPLFAAIEKLPRDAVIGAFPSETSDSIPYLARRSVYLARETHMPFHTRYTELMRDRARALFTAYFAPDAGALRELRDRRGVTHLLVDRRHFTSRPGYFAPFDADIARDFDAGHRTGFAALTLTPSLAVFTSGDWTLLDLQKL